MKRVSLKQLWIDNYNGLTERQTQVEDQQAEE